MEIYKEAYKKKVKFTGAEIYHFKPILLPHEFYDSTGGPFYKAPVDCWLLLHNDNGTTGQCPCSAKMETLLPLLLTGEEKTYEEWYKILYWTIRNNGFSGESAVEIGRVDIAFHDMLAKEEGLALHKFFGATRDWAAVYASGGGTNLTIQEMEKEIQSFIDAGYTTFKMKIATNFGTELDRDVERVRIVRSMIGRDAKLALDANQLWDAEHAMRFFRRVEQYDIAWYEEPVQSYDMVELEKLTRECPVPVSMGESPRCYYPMESYVKAGVKHLQPIPDNQCSVEDWMKTRRLAEREKIQFSAGGLSQMTASYVASGKEEDMVEYLIPVIKPVCDIMEYTPKEKDGRFYLSPDIAGLSISPDLKMLEKARAFRKKIYY